MKPHHVLILAAVLFMGAGLYAAYSTPVGGSGVVTLLLAVVASAISLVAAFHAQRDESAVGPHIRLAITAHLILVGVFAIVATHAAVVCVPTEPDNVIHTTYVDGSGMRLSKTEVTQAPSQPKDVTHRFAAAAFSGGVASLVALTLGFLRIPEVEVRKSEGPLAHRSFRITQ